MKNDTRIPTPIRLTPKQMARLTNALSDARRKTGVYVSRQTLIIAALECVDVDTLAMELANEKAETTS